MCRASHYPKNGSSPGGSTKSIINSFPCTGMARDARAALVVPVVPDLAALDALIAAGFVRLEGSARVALTDDGLARARELRAPASKSF